MTSHVARPPRNATSPRLSLERFADLVDAYGARPERWPAAERPAALALLTDSGEARALRDQAETVDTLLDQALVQDPSPALAERILAAAPLYSSSAMGPTVREGITDRVRHWLRRTLPKTTDWRDVTALATSLLVGVALGYLTPLAGNADGWTEAELQAVDAFAFGALVSEDDSP